MTLHTLYTKLSNHIIQRFVLWKAKLKLNLAIRATYNMSQKDARSTQNMKNLNNYVVLLEIPIRNKKNQVITAQRLLWINRRNFQAVKRKGWLPGTMCVDELRSKAFYFTNTERTYEQEMAARDRAWKRYETHILKTQLAL